MKLTGHRYLQHEHKVRDLAMFNLEFRGHIWFVALVRACVF